MDGRKDRILVPAGMALVAFIATLWLGGGEHLIHCVIGKDGAVNYSRLLIGAVIPLGIGYICNIIFVTCMFLCPSLRFEDFHKFLSAFGLKPNSDTQPKWKKEWRELSDALFDEFHLRLHSHAPQTLINYCSNRNTAWYMAINSGIASILGWFFATAIILMYDSSIAPHYHIEALDRLLYAAIFYLVIPFICWFCIRCRFSSNGWWIIVETVCALLICLFLVGVVVLNVKVVGLVIPTIAFFLVIPIALFWQGHRWNKEFWGVCWKWIYWDLQTHSLPNEWLMHLFSSKNDPQSDYKEFLRKYGVEIIE